MASTINASSSGSGGLISTGDASGVLQLQNNGTVAVTLTSGYFLNGTTSPSFLYSGSSSINSNAFGAVGGGYDCLTLFDSYASNPTLNFAVPNSASNLYRAASIRGLLTTTTAGSEASALAFYTVSGGSNIVENARFNSTGNLVLKGGTTTASGTGITFPASQSASTDANTLDDYEEGTFTPTFVASGCSFSYGQQAGAYTKVGRLVVATIWLRAQASGTTSSQLQIGGLPFAASGTTTYAGMAWGQFYYITFPSGINNCTGYLGASGSQITLEYSQNGTTTLAFPANSLASSNSGFIVTVSYFAS